MQEVLTAEISKVASLFGKHEVKYMFIGGLAVAYYGKYRPSSHLPKGVDYDVDIWYSATLENFSRLSNALGEYDPALKKDLAKIIFDPKRTFLKFNLNTVHFDLLPEMKPFTYKDFHKCHENREIAEISNTEISIISKADLLENERSINRPKDKEDIKNINKNSHIGFSR